MAIPFRCRCGASYDLRDEFAGRTMHCPRCGAASQVGQPPEIRTIDPAMLSAGPGTPDQPPAPVVPGEMMTITSDMLEVSPAPVLSPPQAGGPPLPPAAPADGRVDFEKKMPVAPPLTLLLIVANVIIFIIEIAKGALESKEAIVMAGALERERVMAGEVWRLVSAMFLHGGFDHLVGNCVALYVLGMACEHAFGLGRTALLYMLAGLGGSVVSTVFSPGPSVGASGAIFGLMGAGIVFFRVHGQRFIVRDNRVGVVLMVWAGYSLLNGFLAPFIDNGAHIGGLVTGALLALAVRPAILDRIAARK